MTHPTTTLPAAETSPLAGPGAGLGRPPHPPTPREPGWASAR